MADTSATWVAVLRHISRFARTYSYDRAGLGRSGLPPDFSSADKSYKAIAVELHTLLQSAGVHPPYVLVTHSMGALIGREFLDTYSDEVAGLVLLDAVTEHNHKTRPAEIPRLLHSLEMNLDPSFLWSVHEVALTETEIKDALGITQLEDTATTAAEQERAIKGEVENLIPSSETLATKGQFETTPMGDKPVVVIKGDSPAEWRYVVQQAIKAERPGGAERAMLEAYLGRADHLHIALQFEQLKLSHNSKMVYARKSWHNVQWYQPDLVAREVEWCINEYSSSIEHPPRRRM